MLNNFLAEKAIMGASINLVQYVIRIKSIFISFMKFTFFQRLIEMPLSLTLAELGHFSKKYLTSRLLFKKS